jgi:hypothetical protein
MTAGVDRRETPHDEANPRPNLLARTLILPIKVYQRVISPLFPPSCRFYPCCSAYAVDALRVHGALRGLWLTLLRLLRCGPWHPGGIDPVPPRRAKHTDVTDRLSEE